MNAQVMVTSRWLAAGPVLSLSREGDVWAIRGAERTFWLKDSRGLQYLARLLGEPEREILALDLAGAGGCDVGDAGALLDPEARRSYRRRLEQLDEALREAEDFGDELRASRVRGERELLAAELARAVGLGGRDRCAGSAAERARIAVTRRIRHAVRRIAVEDAGLGRYLDRTIKTGRFCCYRPI